MKIVNLKVITFKVLGVYIADKQTVRIVCNTSSDNKALIISRKVKVTRTIRCRFDSHSRELIIFILSL